MRLKIGGFELESLTSDEIMARAGAVSTSSRPVHLVTFNPLMYLDALADPDFAAILRSADLLLAESSGIKWAAKFLYNLKISPLAGIDMLDALFASDSSLAPSSRAAFYFRIRLPRRFGAFPALAHSRFPRWFFRRRRVRRHSPRNSRLRRYNPSGRSRLAAAGILDSPQQASSVQRAPCRRRGRIFRCSFRTTPPRAGDFPRFGRRMALAADVRAATFRPHRKIAFVRRGNNQDENDARS